MRHKVLFISSWFPNKLEPTNGNFVQRHAEAAALLNDVEVLHTIGDFNQSEKYIFDEQKQNGIRILTVYYKNTNNPLQNFLRRMAAYRKGFRRMQKPEIVHANVLHNSMLFAVYLKKKYGIPFVATEHWTALQVGAKTSSRIKKTAKFIADFTTKILPVSENLKDGLRNLGITTPMKVISNVVNTDVFTISNNANSQPFTFLHISSLIPRKKPEKIIEAAIKLKSEGYDIRLEIGGDGDTQPLKDLVRKNSAENFVHVFGEISHSEVAKKMQNSDCFVLFSENETQGCVILESYACGKPVIATAVGGVPEFVKPGFGVLIEKNDEAQLYSEMKNMMQSKITLNRPEELRDYVLENFSQTSIAKQFTAVYDEVLKK